MADGFYDYNINLKLITYRIRLPIFRYLRGVGLFFLIKYVQFEQ